MQLLSSTGHHLTSRPFFIVNPASGKKVPSKDVFGSVLEKARAEHRLAELSPWNDAAQIASRAIEDGYDHIIVLGGDGTISRVATALIGKDVLLGIVPTGTANMYAREIGLPLVKGEAMMLALHPRAFVRSDVLLVNGRACVYRTYIGQEGPYAEKLRNTSKQLIGRTSYLVDMAERVTWHMPMCTSLTVDGENASFWASNVIVSNAAVLGMSPFRIDGRASPFDGKGEIMVLEGRSRADLVMYATELLVKNFLPLEGSSCIRFSERARVDMTPRSCIRCDGELIGRTPADIQMINKALKVIVPA